MAKLPVLRGKELIAFLESNGFKVIRAKGSHVRLASEDGRLVTVPTHAGKTIPKGLFRKIVREDVEMTLGEFLNLYEMWKR